MSLINLKGPWKRLDRLIGLFGDTTTLMNTIKKGMSLDALALVAKTFSSSKTPSGKPWPKRIDRKPQPLLVKTGQLKKFTANVTAHGFELWSGPGWFYTHQYGYNFQKIKLSKKTMRMGIPPRHMVPMTPSENRAWVDAMAPGIFIDIERYFGVSS